jgi:hypothetical protein
MSGEANAGRCVSPFWECIPWALSQQFHKRFPEFVGFAPHYTVAISQDVENGETIFE